MQRDCHGCGLPIEEQLAFCPSCGAPQIRVTRPEETQPDAETQDTPLTDPPPQVVVSPFSGNSILKPRIDWRSFLRTATPLSALTGTFTAAIPPLGLFILLPASLLWAISRYRRQRPIALRRGQGARMGALMGLLSFCFFLVMVFLNPRVYRDIMIKSVHDSAARNPDPQVQAALQWFTTPDGLLVGASLFLGMLLAIFIVIGMSSGALAVGLGKSRNQPTV